MTINDPEVAVEIAALHEAYEAALVSNNVEKLVTFFWDSPHALRFGVAESLYGAKEIENFRRNRSPMDLARRVENLQIVTFGRDYATVTLEFDRTIQGVARRGRQSQVWCRFEEGWKIVSAHVSLVPALYIDLVSPKAGLTLRPTHRADVQRNIDRAEIIARPLLDFPLDESVDAAPVFKP